jgi:dephospho-CoA kinase
MNDSSLKHASETEQEQILSDFTIDNSKDLEYLNDKIKLIMEVLLSDGR